MPMVICDHKSEKMADRANITSWSRHELIHDSVGWRGWLVPPPMLAGAIAKVERDRRMHVTAEWRGGLDGWMAGDGSATLD